MKVVNGQSARLDERESPAANMKKLATGTEFLEDLEKSRIICERNGNRGSITVNQAQDEHKGAGGPGYGRTVLLFNLRRAGRQTVLGLKLKGCQRGRKRQNKRRLQR